MNFKRQRTFLLIFEALIFTVITGTCVMGLLHAQTRDSIFRYGETAIRCLTIFIFSIIYFSSMIYSSGPDSFFIPLYLISFIFSEVRIFETFSKDLNYVIIPSMTGSTILIASVMIMCLSLIGYGLYNENRNYSSIIRYQLFSIVISIALAVMLPKYPESFRTLKSAPIETFLTAISALSVIFFLVLIINDSHSSDFIRHLAVILLIVGNYLNLFFDSFSMNLAATVFTIVGLVITTIIVRINEIKF